MTDCQMERFALETLKLTARYIEGHRAEYDQWLAEREVIEAQRTAAYRILMNQKEVLPHEGCHR